jgi:hypothetical protein
MAFVSETLTFDKTHYYDTLKPGITLTAILNYGQESVECEARLDTGSSHCIFKRAHGELLGLDIESTVAETSEPLPVHSRRTFTPSRSKSWAFAQKQQSISRRMSISRGMFWEG